MLNVTFPTRAPYTVPSSSRHGKVFLEPSRRFERAVYVITEDADLASHLTRLIRTGHVMVKWFSSLAGYLAFKRPDVPSCLLLSRTISNLPWSRDDGPSRDVVHPPVILLSETGDIPSCVRAIREGAHDFLTMPLLPGSLREALTTAFQKDEASIVLRREREALRKRWRSLTTREAEIMRYVVDGFLNKQTAAELQIAENTVQVHRGRVMRKMAADSFAALVRMSLKLDEWGESSPLRVPARQAWQTMPPAVGF